MKSTIAIAVVVAIALGYCTEPALGGLFAVVVGLWLLFLELVDRKL